MDSLTAWVTTQDFGGGAGRALYKTTDGGITWTKKLANDAGGVALNRFADGQHWFAQNQTGRAPAGAAMMVNPGPVRV